MIWMRSSMRMCRSSRWWRLLIRCGRRQFAPLAQVMLSFNPAASVADADVAVGDLQIAPVELDQVPAQLDLSAIVSSGDAGRRWSGVLRYATDLFDEPTIAELSRRFIRLAEELTADPSVAVGDAALLADADRALVLDRSVGADEVVPAGTVADAVAAQVVPVSGCVRPVVRGAQCLLRRTVGAGECFCP